MSMRELVVAGRHRRVRREHAAAPHGFEVGLVELERLAAVELPLEQAEREQRRVPFVQVVEHLAVVAERASIAAPPMPSTTSWQRR